MNERLNGLPSSEPLLSGIHAYGKLYKEPIRLRYIDQCKVYK